MKETEYILNSKNYSVEKYNDIILAVRNDAKKIVSLNATSYMILALFETGQTKMEAFEKWRNKPFLEKPAEELLKKEFDEVFDLFVLEELLCERN